MDDSCVVEMGCILSCTLGKRLIMCEFAVIYRILVRTKTGLLYSAQIDTCVWPGLSHNSTPLHASYYSGTPIRIHFLPISTLLSPALAPVQSLPHTLFPQFPALQYLQASLQYSESLKSRYTCLSHASSYL